ncbi:MAG: SGNH/GDSL hydrolase family protein [Bacteroidota bacterium]
MATRKISKLQLVEMIENLDLDDEELAPYLEIDSEHSSGFDLAFKTKGGTIKGQPRSDKGLLGTLNKRSRRKRQKKYLKKIKKRSFSGIKIVSEGDSWFQYPIFLKDIIDHLSKKSDYAICSLGYGGDWISNIFRQMEYLRAIRREKPELFLISGGGNDLLAEGNLQRYLRKYREDRPVEEYLRPDFEVDLTYITQTFDRMFASLSNEFKDLQMICHGYDYVIPKSDKWLGKPMEAMGIEDKRLKRAIAQQLIDRFNEALSEVAGRYERVHFMDFRGSLRSSRSWKDELHPRNPGFRRLAKKMDRKIREVVR